MAARNYLGRLDPTDLQPTTHEEWDRVVVCGAGPVGLSAAAVLAQGGVAVTVLEKLPGLSTESRASTFHPPTLELLEELGVIDEMHELGLVTPTTQFRDRHDGALATFDMSVLSDETRYPYRLQLEQSKLTVLLRERLEAQAAAGEIDLEIRFAHRVHSAESGDGCAKLLVGTDSEVISVSVPWVIAADGAHSAVRDGLGIELDGEVYPERFLVCSVDEELTDHLPGLASVNYVADPDEWLVLLRTPDHWRVLFPIPEGIDDDIVSNEALNQRLTRLVDLDRDWNIVESSLYVVARRVASTMRLGRFLLAGDAAHQNSPLGGMGMNSGIQDAFSAARRLIRVLGGEDEALLDTYDEMRRAVAIEHVGKDSHKNWLALREPDADKRAELQAELVATATTPQLHRDYVKRSAMIDSVRTHL